MNRGAKVYQFPHAPRIPQLGVNPLDPGHCGSAARQEEQPMSQHATPTPARAPAPKEEPIIPHMPQPADEVRRRPTDDPLKRR